jgi:hypothetical protein
MTRRKNGARLVHRLALLILRRVLFPFSTGRAGLTGIDGAGWRISGIRIARASIRSCFHAAVRSIPDPSRKSPGGPGLRTF